MNDRCSIVDIKVNFGWKLLIDGDLFVFLVGVGGAVLREKTNELLVIKERVRNIEFWKVTSIRIGMKIDFFFVVTWR